MPSLHSGFYPLLFSSFVFLITPIKRYPFFVRSAVSHVHHIHQPLLLLTSLWSMAKQLEFFSPFSISVSLFQLDTFYGKAWMIAQRLYQPLCFGSPKNPPTARAKYCLQWT